MYIQSACAFCGNLVVRKPQAASANVKIHFCNNGCKSEYQKLAKPVTKEWLEDHYLTKGLDTTQIGFLVKRDPKSVWNWLKDFGIPRRPRGVATHRKPGVRFGFGNIGRKHSAETKERLRAIAIRDGRVPFDPEVGSYMKGRKGADTPNWKGGATPERQAFYNTQEWKLCVKSVWQRDNAVCRRCGLDNRTVLRGTIRFDLHHIDSFSILDRRADHSNVILVCQPCHKWIHSKRNTRRLFLGKGH